MKISLALGSLILFVNYSFGIQNEIKVHWPSVIQNNDEWFAGAEAMRIGDNLLLFQKDNGGWNKNIDMAVEVSENKKMQLLAEKNQLEGTTIDNGATHTQLRYLAKLFSVTKLERFKESFIVGLDYLLKAQYPNGGWPQFYPIIKGYYEHITYNDDAMIGVMNLLRDVAKRNGPYDFVDNARVEKAQEAINKGLEIILATQVKVNGKLTIWCAQHDVSTLEPAKARSYELPSLSGKESVEILEYLMKIEKPTEAVKNAIRSGVKWFQEAKVMGYRVDWIRDNTTEKIVDRVMVKDVNGGPLWGRFNDIQTNKIMFVGRDGIVKDSLNKIERERRVGYSYVDGYATKLLEVDYPEWEKKY